MCKQTYLWPKICERYRNDGFGHVRKNGFPNCVNTNFNLKLQIVTCLSVPCVLSMRT